MTASTVSGRSIGGVTYVETDKDYFAKRQLKRTAGAFGLWAIGISAVISGDFSGWNGGIAQAGWGGMLVAAIVVYLMYVLMLNSISEMASAMPHTGGAYSFARAAMGPWGGFFTGLAETIEYVMTAATIVYFSSAYADAILSNLTGYSLDDHGLAWVWWLALYAIFVVVNWLGAETSFRFAEVVSIAALAIVALFGIGAFATGKADFSTLLNITPTEGNSAFLPFGPGAIFYAMPFAMWLFLGIEQLPLAAEEVREPEKNIPKSSRLCIFTLGLSALIIVFLNPAVVGSEALAGSDEPLLDGYRAILPGNLAAVLSAFALIGLLASIQGIMFAYGRNLYTHSRYATSWAQARRDIPALGTTHADDFYGPIPCTRPMTAEEIAGSYEAETGNVIIETFKERGIKMMDVPGVIVYSHGPFTWEKDPIKAVKKAVVLEEVAMMAYHAVTIGNNFEPMQQELLDKHYLRKHGANAYYCQKKK